MKRDAWLPFLILGIVVTAFALPAPVGPTKPAAAPAPPARPEAALVDDFDRLIQARFLDVRDGRFGVKRVMVIEPRHGMVFHPKGEAETAALDRLVASGWQPEMYVVEPRGSDLFRGGVKGPVLTGGTVDPRPHRDLEVEALAARAMEAKAPALGLLGGVPAEARPVPASSPACLRCHSDKKVGDPLGAVVYSFVPAYYSTARGGP